VPVKAQTNASGRVTDSAGNSLAGATVKVKGDKIVKTNDQGEFTLPVASANVTLIGSPGFYKRMYEEAVINNTPYSTVSIPARAYYFNATFSF
jgi:hypothetical protein